MPEKIRKILKFNKWTQKRLASELGVSAPRLNHWYKNKNLPTEEWLIDKIDELYKEACKYD